MKGVIIDRRGNDAAILMEDGSVRKVRTQGEIGEEWELQDVQKSRSEKARAEKSQSKRKLWQSARVWGSVAAVLALLLVGGGTYYYAMELPVAFVTMDVNPSLEFSLNRCNQVIATKALNADAEAVVAAMAEELSGKSSLSESLEVATSVLTDQAYLNEDETGYVLVDIVADSDARTEKLQAEVEATLGNKIVETDVEISSKEEKEAADDLDMSVGRYAKYLESADADSDADVEDYKSKSVREMIAPSKEQNDADSMEKPEGMEKPDGMEPPEGMEQPDGMNQPDGSAPGETDGQPPEKPGDDGSRPDQGQPPKEGEPGTNGNGQPPNAGF